MSIRSLEIEDLSVSRVRASDVAVRHSLKLRGAEIDRKISAMTPTAESGLIDVRSHHTVDETVQRLTEALRAKGVTLFAVIDHSGEAERVGLKMPPTKLLIFGNPRAGTPLMLAAPRSAIDLPLKLLVWEDAEGTTFITYNSPAYLRDRHGLSAEPWQVLAAVEALAAAAAGE